jgi:hypothetical protein
LAFSFFHHVVDDKDDGDDEDKDTNNDEDDCPNGKTATTVLIVVTISRDSLLEGARASGKLLVLGIAIVLTARIWIFGGSRTFGAGEASEEIQQLSGARRVVGWSSAISISSDLGASAL